MASGGTAERHPGQPPAPPRKSAPGQLWSHMETVHLIEAYEEHWYALKRGQLKAHQWEEVAAAVAARCGFGVPSKTGTQCRHKIEKLRKRYRAERARPVASVWPHFGLMDRMERGPLPISVRPPPPHTPLAASAPSFSDDDDAEEEEEDEEDERMASHTRSINGILREANWEHPKASRNFIPRKRRYFEMEEEESEEEGGGQPEAMSQLAAVVRRFGDGLVRLENRRMELMREMEKDWVEMETKKAEMVMESQRCLVEMIAGAFSSVNKKPKKSQDL